MQNKTFQSGYTTTDFISQEYPDGFQVEPITENEYEIYASILSARYFMDQLKLNPFYENKNKYVVNFGNQNIGASIKKFEGGFITNINSNEYRVSLSSKSNDPRVICSIDDQNLMVQIRKNSPRYELIHQGRIAVALVSEQRVAELNHLMPEKVPQDMSKFLLSPMPGLLIKVCVEEAQQVKAGEELAVVEAMKMENSLRASKDLKIKSILSSEGDNLSVDQKILEFED
jgi:propionyl-CoA carboxylase alpha chain